MKVSNIKGASIKSASKSNSSIYINTDIYIFGVYLRSTNYRLIIRYDIQHLYDYGELVLLPADLKNK